MISGDTPEGKQQEMGRFSEREVVRKWGQSYGLRPNCLCPCQDLTLKTQLEAVNGKKMPALEVFAHALRFFKEHALQVRCDPIPPRRGTDPQVLRLLSAYPSGLRSHLLQPLPSRLMETASDGQVLGRGALGILPVQLGSPS